MKFDMSVQKTSAGTATETSFDVPMSVSSNEKTSSRLGKKHLLIAVVVLLVVGLIVTGVLVGVRMITDSEKEMFKYQLSYEDDDKAKVTETVSTGDGDNTVLYNVVRDGMVITVINDFDKNVQMAKVQTGSGVVCFASVLNRSVSEEPNSVKNSAPSMKQPNVTITYKPMPDQIKDISFFGKRINNLCYNIPTYWTQVGCDSGAPTGGRQKRSCGSMCFRTCTGLICTRYCYALPCQTPASWSPWSSAFKPVLDLESQPWRQQQGAISG